MALDPEVRMKFRKLSEVPLEVRVAITETPVDEIHARCTTVGCCFGDCPNCKRARRAKARAS